MPQAISANLSALLLSAISALLVTSALAAQPALSHFPGAPLSWEVTVTLSAPSTAGPLSASKLMAALPTNGPAHTVDLRSFSSRLLPLQPTEPPLPVVVDIVRQPGLGIVQIDCAKTLPGAPLAFDFQVQTWNVRIDEHEARLRLWPEGDWKRQYAPFLDTFENKESDFLAASRFIEKHIGEDLKCHRPYDLAKVLAAAAIDQCRNVNSSTLIRTTPPSSSVVQVALTGAADDAELPVFLCTLYRAAGLPARVVWGLDVEHAASGEYLPCRRSWVEFVLPGMDESQEDEWIPVDVVRQRESGSQAPPLNQPWSWFGNNTALEHVIPYAWAPWPPRASTNEFRAVLSGDCLNCPDRTQPGRSTSFRPIWIRPAVLRPDR